MPLLENKLSHCEQCGAPLKSGSSALGCLNCLLLGGPNDSHPEARRFQHYEICLRADGVTLHELGHGAMGITYRARDVNLDSPVALKIISTRYSENPAARERFQREARAAAQLRHANVASVFHFGETAAGQCFYAMELVEGETLEARVQRDGPLPVMLVLEVATQVARALMAAEAHGLVHRDLKPSNLMTVAGDLGSPDALAVKVIDFGLAKAAAALPIAPGPPHAGFSGTPEFASPEQFSRGEVGLDARSDIYSLGATLWYLLCGRPPFADRALGEGHDQPFPLEEVAAARVPAPVIALLRSMLATDPAKRPPSARQLFSALQRCRQTVAAAPRRRLAALAVGLLLVCAVGLTIYFSHRPRISQTDSVTDAAPPAKSIAVLPFENLSDDKQNAYFADGIQVEILTDLGKIAELKVIGRTSVTQYKSGVTRNLREIGRQLGVAHLLEGSVQRASGKVRVNAQLIDARSDTRVWARTYDRDLADVFAIQSDIALQIATQLQAKLSPRTKFAIEERPTKDLGAYDLYVRAKLLTLNPVIGAERLEEAARLLDQAIARDPVFFLAHCLRAETHSILYGVFDHTPARHDLADAAVRAALHLRPDAGEAHLARAQYLSRCNLDYDHARAEVALALRTLPNSSEAFLLMGSIDRRQGRWDAAVRYIEKASKLDPRNLFVLRQLSLTYEFMRRFAESAAALDRASALAPEDSEWRVLRAWCDLFSRADPRPLRKICETLMDENPEIAAESGEIWISLALCERDPALAERALATIPEGYDTNGLHFPRTLLEGLVARIRRDDIAARKAFTAARAEVERTVREQPNYGPPLCVLGLIDAGLGRKEDAIREGQRASELVPVAKYAIAGSHIMQFLGVIYAWTGEKDRAIEQVRATLQIPGLLNYGDLRLHPFWDPLRDDPRFEKIVALLAPKDPL